VHAVARIAADRDHPTLFEHTGQDYGSDVTKALSGGKDAVHSGVPYYVAVRHRQYKYVRYLGADEPEELYDLQSDPEELTNRADRAEQREVRERLHRLLLEELRRCDADFVSRAE